MKIKGAIFDMDGTLVDSLMFWGYLWRAIGIKYFGDEEFTPDPAIDRMARTTIYAYAMTKFYERYALPCTLEEFLDFATDSISDFYKNEAKPKAGAVELLSYLKRKNVKLCLASATARDGLETALTATGIKEYFDLIISCADIGVGKDRPDVYLAALRKLGLSKDDVVVIEDSCVALETAKNAGFHTVGVYDKYNFGHDRLKAAAEIYLDDGTSLDALIERFEI